MKRLLTALASFAIVATLFVGSPKPVFASGGADIFYVGFGGGSDAGCGTPDYDLDYGWDGGGAKLEDALYEFLDNDGTLDVTDGDTIVICDGWFHLHAQPYHWDGDLTPGGPDVSPSTLTIRGLGKGDTVIDGLNPYGAGSTGPYRPFYFENTNLILEDMTIMNTSPEADDGDDDSGSDDGGAVYLDYGSLTVNDVDFINSVSSEGNGQAIYAYDADLEINNSTFDNTTGWDWFDSWLNTGDGGAVFVIGSPNPTVTISNSTFQNLGTQNYGGALALICANATVSDSYFYDNTSGGQGGAIFTYGGEDECDSTGSLTIDNSVFEGNHNVDDFGGESDEDGGGGAISAMGQPLTITDSNFGNTGGGSGNWSSDGSGGAIYVDGTSGTLLSIADTEFMDNSSGWWNGGAIATRCANVVITGDATGTASDIEDGASTYFYGNYANRLGGAVFTSGENCNDDEGDGSSDEYVTTTITGAVFNQNHSGTHGGAVANENSGFSWLASFDISMTTFWANTATQGGEGGAVNTDYTDATISNSYFAWNESDENGGAIESCGANIALNNTDFYENRAWMRYSDGGAIYFSQGCGKANVVLQVDGSSFDSNGAGRSGEGGAIVRRCGNGGAGDDYIKNSTFTDNTTGSGGGIHTEADLLVTGSTFDNNRANWGNGGAIQTDEYSLELTVIGSVFTDNTSGFGGGAISTYGGSVTISGSTLDGNSAYTGGGAIRVGKDDIDEYHYSSGLSIVNSRFSNNEAAQGYRYADGGAVNFDGSTGADFTVTNTRFIDNSVGIGEGGAIAADLSGSPQNTGIMTVDKSTFTGNYAGEDGGAINHDTWWTRSTLISVTNSTFSGNTAESDGGAMDTTDAAFVSGNRFVNNTALFDDAGALQLNDEGQTGRSIVTKNSFENNAAGVAPGFTSVTSDGGAIEFDDGGVVITNNVFTRNRAVGSLYSDGGAIEGSGYDTTLSGNSFLYNSATGDGGAVYFFDFSYDYAKSKITGNTFDSNAAGLTGGALWIDDNEAPNDFKAQISDNRILRNTAQYGAGLYITLAAAPKHLSPTGIVKNIFERNIAAMNGGAMMIEYYGGAYRDARVAQQALLKATKNNRYVANKANSDRSTAIVGGLNVGFGPFIDAADEAADPEEAEAAHNDANVRVSK